MDTISEIINRFNTDSDIPEHRYSSFDFCFNYFKETKDYTKDMEKSCLVIGFYLASWGMLRGSSFLLQKSAKYYVPLIKYLNGLNKSNWKIDIGNYNEENIETILKIYNDVKNILIPGNKTHLTLVTKVLLGVFGFVPAYDEYFCKTFRNIYKEETGCGFRVMNKKSLLLIQDFYNENQKIIDEISKNTFTNDFNGGKTKLIYSKAKIVDMYGFSASFS